VVGAITSAAAPCSSGSGKMVGGVSAGMLDFHSADPAELYWQGVTAEYLSAKARDRYPFLAPYPVYSRILRPFRTPLARWRVPSRSRSLASPLAGT